jgi:hypothetical protein
MANIIRQKERITTLQVTHTYLFEYLLNYR